MLLFFVCFVYWFFLVLFIVIFGMGVSMCDEDLIEILLLFELFCDGVLFKVYRD